jgi:hypothetical protein
VATTVLTGRQCTLSIGGTAYTDQILSSTLNMNTERLTFDTLSGKAYKVVDTNSTLAIEFLADWSETVSLAKALWSATESSPDVVISFVLNVHPNVSFTGNLVPSFPSAGGAAADGQQISLELQVVGNITEVFA